MSDDDDDDDGDDTFQSPFENFTSTAPRFSIMLGQHQLSFEEESESGNSSMASASDKKKPLGILEPKHEKRDSGVAGLDESSDIKILEEGPKLSLLSPIDAEKTFAERKGNSEESKSEPEDDDDVETEGEGPGEGEGDGGDTTEEDEEGVITLIDEVSDNEETAPATPSTQTSSKSNPSGSRKVLSHDLHLTSPPHTPARPHSDYSSLVRPTDHTHSPSATRPLSEHAQSPLPSGGIASRLKRRQARAEDITSLTLASHELDITVSPPTPGQSDIHDL